jgi:hypothetical protein
MKPVNDSSAKPAAKDFENSAGDIAELQALITQGIESGAAQPFDQAAFLSRMKTRNDEGS